MSRKSRTDPPRFEVGETVEICSVFKTRFAGLHGKVVEVQPNRYAVTLDKYVVRLAPTPTADAEIFWDIELKKLNVYVQ